MIINSIPMVSINSNKTSFKGVNNFFRAASKTGPEAVQKTAEKSRFFSKIANGAKNLFDHVVLACSSVVRTILKGAGVVFDAVRNVKNKICKGLSGLRHKKQAKTDDVAAIIKHGDMQKLKIGNMTSKGSINTNGVSISAKGNIITVNGKKYQYDGKLPEGLVLSPNGSITVQGPFDISELNSKMQEFAKIVRKNGKLIG